MRSPGSAAHGPRGVMLRVWISAPEGGGWGGGGPTACSRRAVCAPAVASSTYAPSGGTGRNARNAPFGSTVTGWPLISSRARPVLVEPKMKFESRSEERRVGKECRSRRERDHTKKKRTKG